MTIVVTFFLDSRGAVLYDKWVIFVHKSGSNKDDGMRVGSEVAFTL